MRRSRFAVQNVTILVKFAPPKNRAQQLAKVLVLTIALLAVLSIAASCDESSSRGSSDMLTGLMDAQAQATAAAQQYQNIAGRATTIAEATRQMLVLQGQQTRIAQDARATETTFTLSVQATQTTAAANSTRQAQIASATETAQSAFATSTREAQRANATATARAAEYTATANAVIVQATQASASATATANAANAQATCVSGSATSTVLAAAAQTQVERENWARTTEWVWSIFRIVAMLAVAVVLVLAAVRAIQIWMLRQRAFRDANNELVLILPGGDGQEHVTRPGRMPGPVLQMTPPNAQPYQVDTPAADPETTKRDQAISLMRAATAGDGKGNSGDLVADAIMDDPRVQIVDEPPAQLVGGNVMPLLEAKWKEVNDDAE